METKIKNIQEFLKTKGEDIKGTERLTSHQMFLVELELEDIKVSDSMGILEQKLLFDYIKQGCYLSKIENENEIDTNIETHMIVGIDGDLGEIYSRPLYDIDLKELKTMYKLKNRLKINGIE